METLFLIDTKLLSDEAFNPMHGYSTSSNGEHVDYSGSLYNNGGDNLTIAEYVRLKGIENYVLLTWEKFEVYINAYNKREYLDKPVTVISKSQYWEMLEVLPPENWRKSGGFEHFRMCEYLTGSLTAQYATNGDEYITKTIDVTDEDTWIKTEDFKW